MNPSYTLFIDVCLNKVITSESIWMRLVTRVPFVPRNGDNVRLSLPQPDEATTMDIELSTVTYDVAEGQFVADIADDCMVDHYRENGTHDEADFIALYKQYGFVRLNFPQGVGR